MTGDFNGDGKTDIAAVGANGWNALPVALSNGDGSFKLVNKSIPNFQTWASQTKAVVTGDFNGDGKTDIAAVGVSGWTDVPVALSNGDGSFQLVNLPIGGDFQTWASQAKTVVTGDFDDDHNTDMAAIGASGWTDVPVALSNGDGSFKLVNKSIPNFQTWASQTKAVVTGDFDGDGKTDIAAVGADGWNALPVALCNRNGSFRLVNKSIPSFQTWASQTKAVVTGDFNGDGMTDIAAVGADGWNALPVALSNGDGSFKLINNSIPSFQTWASQVSAVVAGDFNGDGLTDVAAVGHDQWGALPVALDEPVGPPVSFAVYGDMPYHTTTQDPDSPEPGIFDDVLLETRIAPAIAANDDISFVLHLGDIGRPEAKGDAADFNSCDNAQRGKTRDFWASALGKQVFFTPGDNDWTDCNRDGVPPDFKAAPNKHLDMVRSNLLPVCSPTSPTTCLPAGISNGIPYERQTDPSTSAYFPENALWTSTSAGAFSTTSVLFVSVHVVGSCNGLSEKVSAADVAARNSANLSWLQKALARAQADRSIRALVIASHADVFTNLAACQSQYPNTGYKEFINAVNGIGDSLAGARKPVLFVHGDTSPHCMDQPFTSKNIWRLNGPGDFHALDADLVTLDPENLQNPFSARSLRGVDTISNVCP